MFIMSFASVGPVMIYLVGGREAISGTITTGILVACECAGGADQ
jgi:hypothetical protein